MTKERKDFIFSLFKDYKQNMHVLDLVGSNFANMSLEDKQQYVLLKAKVEIISSVIEGEFYIDLTREKFISECLIGGKTRNFFSCINYISERTLRRWQNEIFFKVDEKLKVKGI
jgi:hypothetical protein